MNNTGTKYVRIMKQTAFYGKELLVLRLTFGAGINFFLILAQSIYII
jgi:hypothetical protein